MARVAGRETVPWDNEWTQWSGDAHIDCWPDHEITDLFSRFIHALLDDFPKKVDEVH
jgi:hypothetical protein